MYHALESDFSESELPPPKYMLFAWDSYYPLGGMLDFVERFTDLVSAIKYTREYIESERWTSDYYELYELSTGETVMWGTNSAYSGSDSE
jgi:hypothetical protein